MEGGTAEVELLWMRSREDCVALRKRVEESPLLKAEQCCFPPVFVASSSLFPFPLANAFDQLTCSIRHASLCVSCAVPYV